MNNSYLKAWQETTAEEKRAIFRDAGDNIGLPAAAIEKDWWVTYTLKLIFSMEVAAHTVFKGGTSLSKAWNLIDRFSEDIDLALDRKFLGFGDKMSASQVKRLREHSFKYISENFFPLLQKTFQDAGFNEVTLQLRETKANDQDPLIIELYYPGITTLPEYIQPRVLVEIGSRSLMEPYSQISFSSMAGEYYKGESFADETITIPTVNPERTFLEKIFLLHEEFQRPADKMKINRLSRHLYDIEKLMDTPFAEKTLSDQRLYQNFVAHRKTITPLRGIDYANHAPEKINPLPPENLSDAWRKDYEQMRETMIYKESLPFDKLIERIKVLKEKINSINH